MVQNNQKIVFFLLLFQFGNLANPRFIKGECTEKIERKAKRKAKKKENAKKRGEMTLSSAASPPGFQPQTLNPECNDGGACANVQRR
jgi:hypothetical protein